MKPPTKVNTDSLISLISRINRQLSHAMEPGLVLLGLSEQEFRILGLLIGETGISQNELASKLSVRPATLSSAITRLVGKGFVKQEKDPNDQRIRRLQLNPNYDLSPASLLLDQTETQITMGLTTRDIATTKRVLQHLSTQLLQMKEQS